MKIVYDPEVNALHLLFHDPTVTTPHLTEGLAGGPEILNPVSLEGLDMAA